MSSWQILLVLGTIRLDTAFFADSLLKVSYVLGALQKELHIAPFIERFKTVALEKYYW